MDVVPDIAYRAALRWHMDAGADEAFAAEPVNRLKEVEPVEAGPVPVVSAPIGKAEASAESRSLALATQSLDELKAVIQNFGGIAIKKTATNFVFADGSPSARVMVIGEAPGRDEDTAARPFMGESGEFLDRVFSHIGLSRTADRPEESLYMSYMLNWRPPGNRTPTPSEIETSLPFIERHIQLAAPKLLVICGGTAAQALLGRSESFNRLRGVWHDYKPLALASEETAPMEPIPARVIYHPAYILQTPLQKRALWADILDIKAKIHSITNT